MGQGPAVRPVEETGEGRAHQRRRGPDSRSADCCLSSHPEAAHRAPASHLRAAPGRQLLTLGNLVSGGQLCASLYGRYSDAGLVLPAGVWPNGSTSAGPTVQLLQPTALMIAALDARVEQLAGPVLYLRPAGLSLAGVGEVRVPFEYDGATVAPAGYLMDDNLSALNLTVRRYTQDPSTGSWSWTVVASSPPMRTGPPAARTMLLAGKVGVLGAFAVVRAARAKDARSCVLYDASCFTSAVLGGLVALTLVRKQSCLAST